MNAQTQPIEFDPKQFEKRVETILRGLPASTWTTTTPPLYFKIANNTASYVTADYQGKSGELIFLYKNDDGYITIQQTFPPKK